MHDKEKIGKVFLKISLFCLLMAAPSSCNRSGNNQDSTPKEPSVVIHRDGGSKIRVKVQVARTPKEREIGLMYREKLGKGTGMLFIFEKEGIQSFWMKNTLIPLDMIFIGSNLKIAGIVENTEPLTLDPRKVNEKSQFVLEMDGGFCSKYSIKKGMKVSFSGFKHQGGKK